MYSHDTYGLGHLTRTLRIAQAIQARYPNTTILVLSGSPVAPYVPLPPGTDLVKMPSVLKSGQDEYLSRDLRLDFRRLRAVREEVILGTAATFRPHLFLVDNVPTGMKGEVLQTLEYLRGSVPDCKIVLNLRDILDSRESTLAAWEKAGIREILDRFYDRIFVLGDRAVYDAPTEYDLPADRTRIVGYCTPGQRGPTLDTVASSNGGDHVRRILLTTGGGGDGLATMTAGLRALGQARARLGAPRWKIEAVTGPLMDRDATRQVIDAAKQTDAEVHEFLPDLPARMAQSDLVVAMAGYNTCCEILSHAHRAILHPRTTPRLEQWLRATAFERLGLAVATPAALDDIDELADLIERQLAQAPQLDSAQLPLIEGQHRLARELEELHPKLRLPKAERARESMDAEAPESTGPFLRTRKGAGSTLLSLVTAGSAWPQSFLPTGVVT